MSELSKETLKKWADTPHTPGRLYGRRKGRPLHVRKSLLMQELLPQLQILMPFSGPFNPEELFKTKPQSIWLEVGFGGGEHLAAQAACHPEISFIGCEPFQNGVASLLDHIDRRQITNVRIFPDDARLLLEALPENSLQRCFVLYADPWPKKRHADRRFICAPNLDRLARVLKSGAELRLATDVTSLAEWMRAQVAAHTAFKCLYDGPIAPADWIPTRYEEKGIKAGRQPVYLVYFRI